MNRRAGWIIGGILIGGIIISAGWGPFKEMHRQGQLEDASLRAVCEESFSEKVCEDDWAWPVWSEVQDKPVWTESTLERARRHERYERDDEQSDANLAKCGDFYDPCP